MRYIILTSMKMIFGQCTTHGKIQVLGFHLVDRTLLIFFSVGRTFVQMNCTNDLFFKKGRPVMKIPFHIPILENFTFYGSFDFFVAHALPSEKIDLSEWALI